jgi:hypothetical protein
MKYSLIDLNSSDENYNNYDNHNNNNNISRNNNKKRRTNNSSTMVIDTTIDNNNNNTDNMLLYESFCSLDDKYQNSISLYDVYTIYLAYEYLPKELTYEQFQKRINIQQQPPSNNHDDTTSKRRYTFNEVCTILESYVSHNDTTTKWRFFFVVVDAFVIFNLFTKPFSFYIISFILILQIH